jgi:hypothetical protein
MTAARIKRFFEVDLPVLLAGSPIVGNNAIAIEIPPLGAWTVTFGPAPRVEPGLGAGAGLMLAFTPEVFSALLDGRAPRSGDGFTASGDLSRLRLLTAALDGPRRGALGVRARPIT